MDNPSIQLESSWKEQLEAEFSKPYMQQLKQFLLQQKQLGKTIYPKSRNIFNAFEIKRKTRLDKRDFNQWCMNPR